jgi:hypothetical protein
MKRHPALIPLSRDHHSGLVQAVWLRRAAADGDASVRLAAAREFVEFFRYEELSTFGMRKKGSSRYSSGTSGRSLLSSARHASNTCSSRVRAHTRHRRGGRHRRSRDVACGGGTA